MAAVVAKAPAASGPVKGPQAVVGGLALVALAAFAIWLVSDLSQGTLRAMGPAMLPRWLAIGVGACGVMLTVAGFMKSGDPISFSEFTGLLTLVAVVVVAYGISLALGADFLLVAVALFYLTVIAVFVAILAGNPLANSGGMRGPLFIIAGIISFALTIRGAGLGSITIPQLGLIAAGPLAMFVGGYATHEVRFRDLLVLSLALTAACMILFGDLLNLPIPLFPQWLSDMYPTGWSNDLRMRATAAALVLLAVAAFFVLPAHKEPEAVDVVTDPHPGTLD